MRRLTLYFLKALITSSGTVIGRTKKKTMIVIIVRSIKLFKNLSTKNHSQVQWCTTVIPVIQEAKVGESQV